LVTQNKWNAIDSARETI